jgi:acetoin utilization deacetylase AcuC-like enzyme
MDVVFTEAHRSHDPKRELVMGREVDVYEKPARAYAVAETLRAEGHPFLEPTSHGLEPVLAVHDPRFLDHLERAWGEWEALGWTHPIVPDTIPMSRLLATSIAPPAGVRGRSGYYVFDTATPMVAGTYEAARASVDTALTAADLLVDGELLAFALCRPPGHHAGTDFAGGYCFLNNAAIAGTYLRARGGGDRVAFIDLDFHHGNGTQQIFWDDPDTLTVSLHGDPDRQYPYFTGRGHERGGAGGEDANVNLPLPAGIDGLAYLEVVELATTRVAEFAPTWLVVPLGMDTFADDPLGDFALRTEHYPLIGMTVGALQLPTLVVMEGGYAIDALGPNVAGFLQGLEAGARLAPTGA